jgi:hypothetical protein
LNDLLVDPDGIAGYQPDGLHQTVQSVGFQKNARCPKLDRGSQVLGTGRSGNDQETARVTGTTGGRYEIVPTLRAQVQIREHDIDRQTIQDLDSLSGGAALARQFKTWLGCQEPGQTRSKKNLIVDEEQPNSVFRCLFVHTAY